MGHSLGPSRKHCDHFSLNQRQAVNDDLARNDFAGSYLHQAMVPRTFFQVMSSRRARLVASALRRSGLVSTSSAQPLL